MRRFCSNKTIPTFLQGIVIGILMGLICKYTRQRKVGCISIRHINTQSEPQILFENNFQRKGLIFIGVMTTCLFLETRAEAVYKTWGSHVPGKLVFFVGSGKDCKTSLPVVVLNGVADNEFPPQAKVFAMMKYIGKEYGNDFDWFMRADDDVYVNTFRLRSFLMSINSSKDIYMGHHGYGSKKDIGKLGLHKSYCLGGPGVIFSGSLLRRLHPHINTCLGGTVTNHEDVELGRCVEAVTGLSCTQAEEFDGLFNSVYSDKTGAWTRDLKPNKLIDISFHPIKEQRFMFSFHIRVMSMIIHDKVNRLHSLQQEMQLLSAFLSTNKHTVRDCPLCHTDDDQIWTTVRDNKIYSIYRRNVTTSAKDNIISLSISEAKNALEKYLKKGGVRNQPRLTPVSVTYMYQMISPPKRLEHILIVKSAKRKHFTFRIKQNFELIQVREIFRA